MFKQLTSPDRVFTMQFSAELTSQDVAQCKALLDARLAQRTPLSLLVDITELSDIGADALAAGVQADMALLSHIDGLARVAIVSDKEFPGALIGLAKPLLAGLELRSFRAAEHDAALQWAGEVAQGRAVRRGAGAVRFIPTTRADVLAFEIDGAVSAFAMQGLTADVTAFLKKHDSVRMLAKMTHYGGIDPTAFLQSGLLSMKFAALDKVARYAIVGAPGWMKMAARAFGPLMSDLEIRTFAADDEDTAWKWIEADGS